MITNEISQAGTSIWLDDLSRAKLTDSGPHGLPSRIARNGVVGVTTNPSIFNSAISNGAEYAPAIAALQTKSAEEVVAQLTTDDVRSACDLFEETYRESHGVDGKVSIEIDPRLARNTYESIRAGKHLWKIVGRPNAMIKVPATIEGLEVITELISEGISVNATLIFSVERYLEVFRAFTKGLELRISKGESVNEVTSVASFFVSRIDTAVDAQLKKLGTPAASELLGKAAIANAVLAYEVFENESKRDQWLKLASYGARIQRPLWASTGVKDPQYDDTRYVVELIARNTVNTMPQATLDAVIDHGIFHGDTVTNSYEDAHRVFDSLREVGISIPEITDFLEKDGVEKFASSWRELLATVEKTLTT